MLPNSAGARNTEYKDANLVVAFSRFDTIEDDIVHLRAFLEHEGSAIASKV